MCRGLRGAFWTAGLLVALCAVTALAQTPERRVALVIGNGDYDQGRLRNPVNDARAIAQALRRAGFEVIAKENADRVAMYEAINAFGDRLKETKGVGLFFFSGHGLQVQGKNFMVPLRARITSERMVEIEAVDVNRVLGEMDAAQARVNIVILDACRDNPYARSFRSGTRGLAQIDAPRGTLIAYATAPGKVAEDGTGTNSPYTSAMMKYIATPGLDIERFFKRVRVEVLERTGSRQEPWEASSLTGEFFFFPAGAVTTAGQPTIREEIRQEFGSLAISAQIEGIEVWLGDRRVGETKLNRALLVENLAPGNYALKATKPGHQDWAREVQVTANQRAEVMIEIAALPPAARRGEYRAGLFIHRDPAYKFQVPAGWRQATPDDYERFGFNQRMLPLMSEQGRLRFRAIAEQDFNRSDGILISTRGAWLQIASTTSDGSRFPPSFKLNESAKQIIWKNYSTDLVRGSPENDKPKLTLKSVDLVEYGQNVVLVIKYASEVLRGTMDWTIFAFYGRTHVVLAMHVGIPDEPNEGINGLDTLARTFAFE